MDFTQLREINLARMRRGKRFCFDGALISSSLLIPVFAGFWYDADGGGGEDRQR